MKRILFHVQHLLGIGHLRRAELIVEAAAEAGFEVTVALGGEPVPQIGFDKAIPVQLPVAQIKGTDFKVLYDGDWAPITDTWRSERRERLVALYDEIRPHIVLLEMYPFGRWRFGFELEALLERAERDKPRVKCVTSVRDILVTTGKIERREKGLELARRHIDAVLVHGDGTLFRFEETYPFAAELSDRIVDTGYVAEPASERTGPPSGDVIVSAGGGAVAGELLPLALDARPKTPLAARTWRLFTGPRCSDADFAALKARADERTVVERFSTSFQAHLDGAALSISQAGYNTMMNIFRAGIPAVVLPFDEADETEQLFRAQRLSERGVLTMVEAHELNAERLAKAITWEVERQRPPGGSVDLDGAKRTAAILSHLATGGTLDSFEAA